MWISIKESWTFILEEILSRNQNISDLFLFMIWIRLALNEMMLKRYQDAEKYLEEILNIAKSKANNEALIYSEYNNLFLHCLKTNLNKVLTKYI